MNQKFYFSCSQIRDINVSTPGSLAQSLTLIAPIHYIRNKTIAVTSLCYLAKIHCDVPALFSTQ